MILALFLSTAMKSARPLDWSDNTLSFGYGTAFREPYIANNISKNILTYTHADGYALGTNFLNVDFLYSDHNDPAAANSMAGAKQVYVVYRNTFDIGKIQGRQIRSGFVRGVGITAGFDLDAKEDADYNSRKQMLVLGPTLMLDTPGFFNVSLLSLWESNHPSVSAGASNPGYPSGRYDYMTHPMLSASWDIPLGGTPLSFEGFANLIAPKGRDELGNQTVSEKDVDLLFMYDIGGLFQAKHGTLKAGFEYQYWHNKYGNSDETVGTAGGNNASTPMIRIQYKL